MSTINKHTVTTNPQKPVCPKHQQSMRFDKVKSEWVCQQFDCAIVATLKADKREHPPVAAPDVGSVTQQTINLPDQLTLEIRKDNDGIERYCIVVESGLLGEIVIDVSGNVEMVVDEHSDTVSLVLLFNKVKRPH